MRFLLITFVLLTAYARCPASPNNRGFIDISKPFPVVGYLEKRGKVITIKAGSNGPVVSIEEKGWRVIAEDLSEAELLARDPALFRFVKSAIAGDSPGLFLDASASPKPGSSIPWHLPERGGDANR